MLRFFEGNVFYFVPGVSGENLMDVEEENELRVKKNASLFICTCISASERPLVTKCSSFLWRHRVFFYRGG